MEQPRTRHDEEQFSIIPLGQREALALALPRHSRFVSQQLAQHVSAHPDLAYRVAGRAEYVVAGHWRHRPEIVAILELIAGSARHALLEALLGSLKQGRAALIVVDPREQERNGAIYRGSGFTTVETLIQLERRGLDVAARPNGFAICAMEERDMPAVLEVDRHSFPFLWWNSEAEMLWYAAIPGVELYVARPSDRPATIVGYAGFTIFNDEAHLDRIAVRPDFQGRGCGAALLAFSMRRMRRKGARRVALTTQVENTRSQTLYKRFGFHTSDWQQDILGLWLR